MRFGHAPATWAPSIVVVTASRWKPRSTTSEAIARRILDVRPCSASAPPRSAAERSRTSRTSRVYAKAGRVDPNFIDGDDGGSALIVSLLWSGPLGFLRDREHWN